MKDIDKYIEVLANKFDLNFDAPINIIEIAEKLGFAILNLELPKDTSGVILVDEKNKFIGVRNTYPLTRNRFTVAHELGHYFLETYPNVEDLEKYPEDKNIYAHRQDYYSNNVKENHIPCGM